MAAPSWSIRRYASISARPAARSAGRRRSAARRRRAATTASSGRTPGRSPRRAGRRQRDQPARPPPALANPRPRSPLFSRSSAPGRKGRRIGAVSCGECPARPGANTISCSSVANEPVRLFSVVVAKSSVSGRVEPKVRISRSPASPPSSVEKQTSGRAPSAATNQRPGLIASRSTTRGTPRNRPASNRTSARDIARWTGVSQRAAPRGRERAAATSPRAGPISDHGSTR